MSGGRRFPAFAAHYIVAIASGFIAWESQMGAPIVVLKVTEVLLLA